MSRLSKRVWENKKLTLNTKMKVYQACVLSTLLYGSETWPTYSVQERRLPVSNSVYQRHLRTIMHITWKDHVSNHDILAKGKIPSLHALISQRRLRWLWHVTRMEDGRIPKDFFSFFSFFFHLYAHFNECYHLKIGHTYIYAIHPSCT